MDRRPSSIRRVLGVLWVGSGALTLTLAFFLVLPFMQAIRRPAAPDLMVQAVDTANLPPPPPPPPPEPEKKPEKKDEPPKLTEDAPPLDLSQLELALNPGFSGDWLGGDFAVKLDTAAAAGEGVDALFSLADLDQPPRVIYQPSPVLDRTLRRRTPATVYVIFIVNDQGRVEEPIVQQSSDSVFDKSAVAAVRQWKFEPGKRNGKPVRFRMRVPITFPKGR